MARRRFDVALAFRGIVQPLTELRAMRSRYIPRAFRLADPANGGLDGQDPVSGRGGVRGRA